MLDALPISFLPFHETKHRDGLKASAVVGVLQAITHSPNPGIPRPGPHCMPWGHMMKPSTQALRTFYPNRNARRKIEYRSSPCPQLATHKWLFNVTNIWYTASAK